MSVHGVYVCMYSVSQPSEGKRQRTKVATYSPKNIITKLPETGDLCCNITEFGVAEGSSEPAGDYIYYKNSPLG